MASLEEAQARQVDVNTILNLYDGNLVGFKEARSLLEGVFPAFAEHRDFDLDNQAVAEDSDV